jgi:hypothetical protein
MSTFPCPICKKIFYRYLHYENHLNRKTSCLKPFLDVSKDESDDNIKVNSKVNTKINTEVNTNIEVNSNKCKYCNKVYSRNDSLLRHINTSTSCKQKKEFDDLHALNEIKNPNENDKYTVNFQLINMIVEKSRKIEELTNKIEGNKNNNILSDEVNINKMKESSTLILNDVVIIARCEDSFINATQLCKAGNKLFADWYRLDTTNELIKELEKSYITNSKNCDMGIPISQNPKMGISILENSNIENDNPQNDNKLISRKTSQNPDMGIPISANLIKPKTGIPVSAFVKINKGNSSKFTQGTWIHPDLAIQLAQWISPKFALQVSIWIRTLLTTGTVSLNKLLEEKEHELMMKNEKIKLLQNSFLKKQYRKDYPEKFVIYMLTNEDHKNKRIYIIGKAIDLKNRLSNYNKSSEHEVIHYRSCNNREDMTIIESLVLTKLKIYREQANRDRFILPLDKDVTLFTNIIDDCVRYVIS